MSKPEKIEKKPAGRVEITAARTPKKKTVHADPFARLQLHPLEELEARDNSLSEDNADASLFSIQYDQAEPSRTGAKTDQGHPSRTKTDQVEPRPTKQKKIETSPSKNFTKVPNSITKLAIPEKYFRGLSKHTYDILYQRTRGAINPTRTIELTKNDLVKLSGLAIHTVKLHIKYLNESGLLVTHRQMGKHTGYIYEVFVPEEIESNQAEPSASKQNHNLVGQTDHNLALLGHTQTQLNTELDEAPKTSFKDFKENDDERAAIFSIFIEKFEAASKKLTGKNLSRYEKEKWGTLADLLILELERASRNTSGVSSVPAFLTAVLRAKLLVQTYQPERLKSVKRDAAATGDEQPFEIKPLDEQGRQSALEQLRDFKDEDFLEDFKKWYVGDDWKWLVENL